MKKILISALVLIFALSGIACAAKNSSDSSQKIAVIIIADPDFKTKKTFKHINDFFGKNAKKDNISLVYGEEVQSKYLEYWFDKGELEEGKPTKDDLTKFVEFGEYDKVIYLVVKDVSVNQNTGGAIGSNIGSTTILTSTAWLRASVTVNGFLVDREKIIKITSSTKISSDMSQVVYAKQYAFKPCMREISEVFNPLLR